MLWDVGGRYWWGRVRWEVLVEMCKVGGAGGMCEVGGAVGDV